MAHPDPTAQHPHGPRESGVGADALPAAPISAGPQAIYEAHLAAGRFMIQRSAATGQHVFWPRVVAPSGERDLDWVPASGGGTVYAITVNRSRGGTINIALIDLDEGVRMMSTLPDVETVPIGTRVRARIDPGPPPRVVFDPEPAATHKPLPDDGGR